MELLAAKIEGHRADLEERAFMTGIMSLMPALMGMPLEEILRDSSSTATSKAPSNRAAARSVTCSASPSRWRPATR